MMGANHNIILCLVIQTLLNLLHFHRIASPNLSTIDLV